MKRSLYEYCLGFKPNSLNRPKSAEARAVHALIAESLNTGVPNDAELLQQLLTISMLDDEVFRFLKPLHGCGGSEGYVLEVEPKIEAQFWTALATKFSDHQGVCYLAADASLLAGDRASAQRFFIQGFRLDTETGFPFADDCDELLKGTDWHLEYRLHLLAQTRRDYPEEVGEEAEQLKSEYQHDAEKLKWIDAVVDGSDVPKIGG